MLKFVPNTLALANASAAPVTESVPYTVPTTTGVAVDETVPSYVFVALTALIASGAGVTDTDEFAVASGL